MVTFLYEEAKRESGVLWFSTRVVKATKVPSGILRKLSVKVCTKLRQSDGNDLFRDVFQKCQKIYLLLFQLYLILY